MNAVRGSSNATDDAGVRLLEAVRALQPRLREAAAETEANRRLAPPLIGALTEVGLFRMLVPRSLGGGEVDPATALRVIEEAGSADGAAGWCVMIGATSALLAAYLPEMVAASIYAAPEVVTGGALAPTGRALVTDGGYHVSGRWAFGSGIEHCAWRIGACVVFEDGAPRMLADGVPDVRIVLVSAAESDVIDTWSVAGLRGTGSHDFAVTDCFVPAERTIDLRRGPVHPGALYRFPIFGLLALGVAAAITGMARGAIDALTAIAATKVPTGSRRALRERVHTQTDVAQAEALLRAARAFLYDAVDQVWQAVQSGAPVTVEQRALLRLAAAHAARSGAQVVDLMYNAGGATSIYANSPLQRYFRDVHTATQHTMVAPTWYETAGRLFLGLESDTAML